MDDYFFEFFNSEKQYGFRFLKSKNNSVCGDHNLIKDTENFSYIINCDGVSATSSPEKSSRLLIETLDEHFKNLKSKKPRLGKITEIINKVNKEYLKKDLATTLDLFVFSKKFNYYLGLGDSSFYIFNEDDQIHFQNWIHNQSKIIEDHFGSSFGPDNVLVNCVGIQHPRFEMSENIKLVKNYKLLFYSDGLEQFFTSPEQIYKFCSQVMNSEKFDDTFFDNNNDDLSIVFCILK